jgi:hypothetical protein
MTFFSSFMNNYIFFLPVYLKERSKCKDRILVGFHELLLIIIGFLFGIFRKLLFTKCSTYDIVFFFLPVYSGPLLKTVGKAIGL